MPSRRGALRLLYSGAAGYLLGTLPSADVAARLATGARADLRTEGSGNPGAANAMAVLGSRWGYGVLGADIGKGAAACLLGRRGWPNAWGPTPSAALPCAAAASSAVILYRFTTARPPTAPSATAQSPEARASTTSPCNQVR